MKYFIASLLLLIFVGCASMGGQADDDLLKQLSTGAVPCSEKEISVVDSTGASGFNLWSWKVKCDGDLYFCSKGHESAATCSKKKK